MKKNVLLCILAFFSIASIGQTTVQIGSSTANSNEPPFGIYRGHERAAAIYTRTEIGSVNNTISVDTLRWWVATSNPNSYSIKIYLKTTTAASMSGSWETNVSGATLVYDGPASFPGTGWYTFDISDFIHSTNAGNNLMVLGETNWGGIGASATPKFYYTSTGVYSNSNEWWYYDDPPATQNLSKNRPNIKITYHILTGVIPPSGFMAAAVSSSGNDLVWTQNSGPDDVMVAFNTVNTFGTPSGTYVEGNTISGGGTVIYNGPATSFSHTGLASSTTYYYMAWSVHSSPLSYSSGTTSNATTYCDNTNMYPFTTDFELPAFPPSCWSLNAVPWVRSTAASGYGAGTASAMADFYHFTNGNVLDLISPPLDLSSMPFPVLKFDHAYATNTTQVDSLQLWVSNDYGVTFTWLTSWAGGVAGPLNTGGTSSGVFIPNNSQWRTKRYGLPEGTNRIRLRGVSAYGNNLYLDNIIIYDTACATVSVPYNEDFNHYTTPTTGCIKVTNTNGDGFLWATSSSYPQSAPNSIYINHNSSAAMDDWFFTPAIDLTGGTTYVVSFGYHGGGSPSVEKLEVKWGTSQTSGGMTGGQIWNNANIQNSAYLQGTATFTPSFTNSYYLGWHGYSAANNSWLCVDDIHVDIASVTWNGSFSEDWSEPQNWTPNVVPTEYQTVTIPFGTPNDPVLYISGLVCKQLTISGGVILNLATGSGITINGNLTIQDGATLNNDGVITVNGNLVK
jgi:hypothetical protein